MTNTDTVIAPQISFYRFNKVTTADLVVFVNGDQVVLGTYRLRKIPGMVLTWSVTFSEGDGPEKIVSGGWTVVEAKKNAQSEADRRVWDYTQALAQ